MISNTWTKSTRSGTNGGQCVEVRRLAPAAPIEVRDSKDPSGPALAFSPAAWAAFIARK